MNAARRFGGPSAAAIGMAIAATLVLALLALNNQSLWTDELGTWRLTQADNSVQWLAQLIDWPNSDAQIPLYHLYMWVWVQVFASTEVWLRAANLPWIFLAFATLLSAPVPAEQRRLVVIFAGVLLLHPMVWYYTNEARPYAMILAGACLAISGLLGRLTLPDGSPLLAHANGRLIAGTALMAATSVLGVIWSIAFLLPVLGTLRRQDDPSLAAAAQITRGNVALAAACCLVLLPVGAQYAWTVLHGISATAYYENTWANFAFGLYEIAGFDGLGPGREELRAVGASAVKANLLPLVVYGIAIAVVLTAGLRQALERNDRRTVLVLASALIPLLVLFALGTLKHWRVVGRHMMPLLMFFALFIAMGIDALWRTHARGLLRLAGRVLAGATLVALAASSIEIAHAERHRREDFRDAARLATQYLERSSPVWWVAHIYGAGYYGLPLVHSPQCAQAGSSAAILLESPTRAELDSCPEPQVIFLERNDTEGTVAQYASEHHFRRVGSLTGFEILGK